MSTFALTTVLCFAHAQKRTAPLYERKDVFLVTAAGCLHEPSERTQTGFRLAGTKGIITALHGVIDSRVITITGFDKSIRQATLTIYEVDVRHDLARLSSPELEKRSSKPGLPLGNPYHLAAKEALTVCGYPADTASEELQVPLTLGTPGIQSLPALAGVVRTGLLKTRQSPSIDIPVLYTNGFLQPGHSGAPILDKQGRVVAIGNGGLGLGSGIGWGILSTSIQWASSKSNPEFQRIKSLDPAPLFSFERDPLLIQLKLSDLEAKSERAELKTKDLGKLFNVLVAQLEAELKVKDLKISSLESALGDIRGASPSNKARELAKYIPSDADKYALALKAIALGDFRGARRLLKASREEAVGKIQAIDIADGEAAFYEGDFTSARSSFKVALDRAPKDDELRAAVATTELYLGNTSDSVGQFESLEYDLEHRAGADPVLLARIQSALGVAYVHNRQSTMAEGKLRQALKYVDGSPPKDLELVSLIKNNLAIALSKQEKFEEALPLMQESVKAVNSLPGDNRVDISVGDSNIAELFLMKEGSKENAKLAIPFARDALKLSNEAIKGESYASALNGSTLAKVLYFAGEYKEASSVGTDAVKSLRALYGPDAPILCVPLQILASINVANLDKKSSEQNFAEALRISRISTAPNQENEASVLVEWGQANAKQNDLAAAESHLEKGANIRLSILGTNSWDTIVAFNNLANVYLLERKLDKAEENFKKAHSFALAKYEVSNWKRLMIQDQLAVCYHFAGKGDLAVPLEEEVLKFTPPSETIPYAKLLNNMGAFYKDVERYDDAEPVIKRAHTIAKKVMDIPLVIHYLKALEDLYTKWNRVEKLDKVKEELRSLGG